MWATASRNPPRTAAPQYTRLVEFGVLVRNERNDANSRASGGVGFKGEGVEDGYRGSCFRAGRQSGD